MNCIELQAYLDDLLLRKPGEPDPTEVCEHIESCPACAADYQDARDTLSVLQQPTRSFRSINQLKEQIMSQVIEARQPVVRPVALPRHHRRTRQLLAAAAILIVIASVSALLNRRQEPGNSAFGIISRANAAEAELFKGKGIVQTVNRILVRAMSNAELARLRWLPVVTMDATGKPHFDKLNLGVEAGKEMVLFDESCYDAVTGRFAHVIRTENASVFAIASDAKALYSLGNAPDGTTTVTSTPIDAQFRPPDNPATFLGIPGSQGSVGEKESERFEKIGEATLQDGTAVEVIKSLPERDAPEGTGDSCVLFKVRKDTGMIAETEFFLAGESSILIQREKVATVDEPSVSWNLARLIPQSAPTTESPIGITKDMVISNVTVQHMVERAGFTTYVFEENPLGSESARITDVLDLPSPPNRLFVITHRAQDRRHVVMAQAQSYNKMLGPMLGKTGQLIYTSPGGFKVFGGPRGAWLADILLKSASADTGTMPGKEVSGYVLQSPAGTYPVLAINGKVTDEELHVIVDSLVPAKAE